MKADPGIVALALGLVLCVAIGAPGCSPGASGSSLSEDDPAAVAERLEVECERGLETLDRAIERSRDNALVARAALEEARALRDAAGELYLVAEFTLALELIDEALSLLGGA
jgi:hypothetical protein